MVQITVNELMHKLEMTHAGQRMPLLNAFCESTGNPMISKGIAELTKGLRTHIYNIANGENYLTSVAVSQDDPGWIALGSAQQQHGGKYYLYFVLDITAAGKVTEIGPRFKMLHTEELDIPIYSLDWSGPHLLVGSKNGLTRLYTLRENDDQRRLILVAEYKAPAHQMACLDEPMYVPGRYPMNSMIKRIQFAPHYSAEYVYQQWQPLGDLHAPEHHEMTGVSSQFLATFGNRVNIWDTLAEDAPTSSIEVHSCRLNCANWSPHAPQSLIVAGGCARSLDIIDTRANCTVWMAPEAHSRAIRDARFNTFIPYWVASGGEDGVVNVFDIRATHHAPVAKITGHEAIVESLSWSNMRPENLATTSGDGTFRMWMLQKDAVPVCDSYYRTARWSKKDTPPASLRPIKGYMQQNWLGYSKPDNTPWSKMDEDKDDQWGHSLDFEPQTMLVTGAVGVGEWGRTDTGPVFIGEDIEKSKGPVVQVRMSKTRLADYYCITTGGQLCVQTVRLQDGDNIKYKFKFNKDQDPIARQIEYYIYVRKITQAHQELKKLKNMVIEDEEKEKQRQIQVEYFEDHLKTSDAIQPDTWGIDTLPNLEEGEPRLWTPQDRWDLAVSAFQKDLEYWSHRLPPNYATQYHFDLNIQGEAPLFTVTTPPDDDVRSIYSGVTSPSLTPLSLSSTSAYLSGTEDSNVPSPEGGMLARLPTSTSTSSLNRFSSRSTTGGGGDNESVASSHHHNGLPGLMNRSKHLRRMFSRRSSASVKSSSTQQQEQQQEQQQQERTGMLDATPPMPLTKKRSVRRNAVASPS